jgi:hypothetical protein
MKENQLRELLRKEIRAQLKENDFLKNVSGTVRSALGPKKQQFVTGLGKMDTDTIKRMPDEKKAELVAAIIAQIGLTADDVDDIKNKLARKVGKQTAKLGAGASMKTEAKQPINEDTVSFLTQVGLPTIAKAFELLGKGDYAAAGNAFDLVMTRGHEAGALLGSIAVMAAGGGALGKLAAKAIALLNKKEEEGDINLDADQEKTIDKLADKVPAADMQMAMQEVKSYYKQKALLEAKRRNPAKRKK